MALQSDSTSLGQIWSHLSERSSRCPKGRCGCRRAEGRLTRLTLPKRCRQEGGLVSKAVHSDATGTSRHDGT